MIIKHSDNSRERDIAELETLLSLPGIDEVTRRKIMREIKNIRSGIAGEREAAYQMDFHYADSQRWVVIHDLRLNHEGVTAQIDHLILNRFMEIYVCESKHFHEGVEINAHGEFSALYQGKPYGIPSPIEQNERHIMLLKKVFDSGRVALPMRLGLKMKPKLHSLILVGNSARISRPPNAKRIKGLDRVIKNEQVFRQINRDIDTENLISAATSVAKAVSCETLHTFAAAVAALHEPLVVDWRARFGIAADAAPVCCAACGKAVTKTVEDYCRQHDKRFRGKIYCYQCQQNIRAA